MSKAVEVIENYARDCSNEIVFEDGNGSHKYVPWLTPDQALEAVEIEREDTLQEVKSKLLYMLNTSVDNKHFFEQLDEYIEELTIEDE